MVKTFGDGDAARHLRPVVGGMEFSVPCRASSAHEARVFIPEEKFDRTVVAMWAFNARTPASISGQAVAWSYADGHGMRLGAVLRRGGEFELWLPGYHSHGPGERYRGSVSPDGEVSLVPLPTAKEVQL